MRAIELIAALAMFVSDAETGQKCIGGAWAATPGKVTQKCAGGRCHPAFGLEAVASRATNAVSQLTIALRTGYSAPLPEVWLKAGWVNHLHR